MTQEVIQRLPVHRRVIEIEAFEDGDELDVITHLTDRRPWAVGAPNETLHDMTITVRVDADMRIVAAEARMTKHPHTECPRITEVYRGLVGVSVVRGFSREVKARFSGVDGCAHLSQAALALGPAIMQARVSRTARRAKATGAAYDGARGFARDSCHLWAEDGVVETKLELGWRPGMFGDYPAKPLQELRARLSGPASGDPTPGTAP